jgi:hypothetical protein
MSFDSIKDVEEFYKEYAHDVGFSVRVGQQKNGEWYCSLEAVLVLKDIGRSKAITLFVHLRSCSCPPKTMWIEGYKTT